MKAAGPVPAVAQVDPVRDPAAFIYTGGTTGLSKGAMLSHANLVANAIQGRSLFSDVVDGQDAILCVLPFFHSFGIVAMNLGDPGRAEDRAAPAVRPRHGAEGALARAGRPCSPASRGCYSR